MKIHYGTTRIVVLMPAVGIAVKLPYVDVRRCRWTEWNAWTLSWRKPASNWCALLKGVVANHREWLFWKRTQHSLLWPTIWSLCGLVNVQHIAPSFSPTLLEHSIRMSIAFGYEPFEVVGVPDGHVFEVVENFTMVGGALYLLDYGDVYTHEVVQRWGTQIQERYKVKETK